MHEKGGGLKLDNWLVGLCGGGSMTQQSMKETLLYRAMEGSDIWILNPENRGLDQLQTGFFHSTNVFVDNNPIWVDDKLVLRAKDNDISISLDHLVEAVEVKPRVF